MRKYLVKRLLLSVVILFFVTFIIYLLMRCMPSSYVENMARQLSQAPGSKPYEEWLAQLNAQYGLDLGLIPGFFVQLKNLCTGNFGDSWKYTVPVIQKFNEVIWVSFIMGAISLVFELLIAVPLGIVAATKQYSVTDYTVTTVALLGMSLPTFFFATLLKLIFCIKLGWFDLYGLIPELLLWGSAMYFALRLERIKKANNVQSYREILAFSEGKRLDEIEQKVEAGKRPYQKVLLALLTAGITLLVGMVPSWLLL